MALCRIYTSIVPEVDGLRHLQCPIDGDESFMQVLSRGQPYTRRIKPTEPMTKTRDR